MAEHTTPRLGLDKYTAGSDPHPNREKFNQMRDQLESLVSIAEQGTLAARPSAGRGGALYCATDQNNRLYYDTGTGWVEVAPVGGVTPTTITAVGSSQEGISHRAARADHTHVIPLVTQTASGSMRWQDKVKLDGSTSQANSSSLMQRNSSGQVSLANPSLSAHAANKGYVDTTVSNAVAAKADTNHTHSAADITTGVVGADRLPLATSATRGAMSAPDKGKLDGATSNISSNSLVLRDSNYQFQVGEPTLTSHVTTKFYVDTQVASLRGVGSLSGVGLDLNNVVDHGLYLLPLGDANQNYPTDGSRGLLEVNARPSAGRIFQRFTDSSRNTVWVRHRNSTAWNNWALVGAPPPSWLHVTMLGDWRSPIDLGNYVNRPRFSINQDNVTLRGVLTNGSGNTTIGTITEPAWPAYKRVFPVVATTDGQIAMLTVDVDGTIKVGGFTGTTELYLDGITYQIAA